MVKFDPAQVTDKQYEMLATRRITHDMLIWQTPVISLTAQAFLFTIALGDTTKLSRIIASTLAFLAAFASAQLLAKHRHFEVHYSRLLQEIEHEKKLQSIHEKPPKGCCLLSWSSYKVWLFTLSVFGLVALAIGVATALGYMSLFEPHPAH